MKVDVRPSMLDRAIGVFSPRAAEVRIDARTRMAMKAELTGYGSGGYRGGQPDRQRRRGLFARARSAAADILPGSARLRASMRDAAMNTPIATAAINRVTAFTVGTGLMALPAIDGEKLGLSTEDQAALELRIATDFDAYMASKDPDAEQKSTGYGQQAIVKRGSATSGEILALRVLPESQAGRVYLTAWKLAEADRLCQPPGIMDGGTFADTGNMVTGGVETDGFGAPVAYWILKQHPGDIALRGADATIPQRIEAWDRNLDLPNVLHVFKKERPEQPRGVGMLATVIEPLRMISDASDAELYATVMSAMIAIVYKSPGATPLPEPVYDEGEDGAPIGHNGVPPLDEPRPEYKFESGSVLEIDNQADVEIKSPGRPNSAFEPFFQAIVRQIGAALGIPAGVLMLMFNSSYTASKAELETFWLEVRADRAWLGADWCEWIYICFLAEKVARGDYAMPGFFDDLETRKAWCGVDWRGDGKISLNLYQEANGYKLRQDNGWQTGEEITAELTGGNFRQNILKRGQENKLWIAQGLPVALAPGSPGQAAGAAKENPPAGGGSGDDDKTDKENEDA